MDTDQAGFVAGHETAKQRQDVVVHSCWYQPVRSQRVPMNPEAHSPASRTRWTVTPADGDRAPRGRHRPTVCDCRPGDRRSAPSDSTNSLRLRPAPKPSRRRRQP